MFNIPKVSVIVPVYNCEKYIPRCIDSLINQTIEDIEIIIINDESEDGTFEILKFYEKNDNRIKLITTQNRSVSQNRNMGLDYATGKYICFVDSDDWIDLDALEIMYEIAEKNKVDIVMSSYIREFNNHSKEKDIELEENKVYEGEDLKLLHRKMIGPIGEEFSHPESLDSLGTVWAKLYRRDLILENNNKFVDLKEIGTAEDTLFNLFLFKYVTKLMFTKKCFYHYWKENENSITTKYNLNMFKQWKNLFRYMKDFIELNNLENSFSQALNNRICISVLGLGLNECKEDNKISFIKKVKNIKYILNDEDIKKHYKTFELKYFPIHWRLFYYFNKKGMAFASYIMINIIDYLRKRM